MIIFMMVFQLVNLHKSRRTLTYYSYLVHTIDSCNQKVLLNSYFGSLVI